MDESNLLFLMSERKKNSKNVKHTKKKRTEQEKIK